MRDFIGFYIILLLVGSAASCTGTSPDHAVEDGTDSQFDTNDSSTDEEGTDPDRDTQPDSEQDTTSPSDSGTDAGTGSDGGDPGDTDVGDGGVEEDSETLPDDLVCNGHAELCDRRFDEVLFPMTHNSFSAAAYGFMFVANHDTGLAAQLEGGVRGFMLDIYENDGRLRLCHGPCMLGSFSHPDALDIFARFLEKNPSEIITFVYQDSDNVNKDILEKEFTDAGLLDLLYVHKSGGSWPTLGEMIENDTRLFITTERQGGPQEWLHHAYDLMWDTKYSHKSTDDFDCEVLRGDKGNDLFLINHWVNSALDLPSKSAAAKSNSLTMLLSRLERCHAETGQMPNFIAVDFWEQGDLVAAVKAMNGL